MGIIIWVSFGAITAWVYEGSVRRINLERPGSRLELGMGRAIFCGIMGALVVGWAATLLTLWPTMIGLTWASVLLPIAGSFVGLWLMRDLSSERSRIRNFDLRVKVTDVQDSLANQMPRIMVKRKQH